MHIVEINRVTTQNLQKLHKLMAPYVHEVKLVAAHSFDLSFATRSVERFIENNSYVVFVVEDNSEFIAVFIASIDQVWWSDKKMTEDIFLYVAEKHRGTLAAVKLIQAYKDWALGHGADVVRLSSMSGIHPERTAKLYQRMGFDPIGMINVLEVG